MPRLPSWKTWLFPLLVLGIGGVSVWIPGREDAAFSFFPIVFALPLLLFLPWHRRKP